MFFLAEAEPSQTCEAVVFLVKPEEFVDHPAGGKVVASNPSCTTICADAPNPMASIPIVKIFFIINNKKLGVNVR